ncbi:aldolase [Pseudoalteromonas phenolica]|uniref:Aldolase n=1 Tax=Pseudoalteromonas phenolica TaxID=161398 RepID=A0A4Q7IRH4_9GAMM|nr:aldolase/citrate lyase family protein [Pseudoalteromonas phenolica]RZQ54964.1 aldolase [Pseudoalteromonas phenolica]
MKFIYITNDINKAKLANELGVEYIMVDLEINGKIERQGHLNTLISKHSLNDVKQVSEYTLSSKLLVRVNPLHDNTAQEVESVLASGAKALMLPMFEYPHQVKEFIEIVDGRAEIVLLFETPASFIYRDDILKLSGISRAHLGLNDMHIAMNLSFMFDLFPSGIAKQFAESCKHFNVPFGFGGVAPLGAGLVDSSLILKEHFKLGSDCAILSRDFHFPDLESKYQKAFSGAYLSLATYLDSLKGISVAELDSNSLTLNEKIKEVSLKRRFS